MKNAFIFDMDGTLGETIPLAIAASKKAFEALGLSVPSKDEIVAHFGPTELGLFKILNAENGEKLFKEYLKYYDQFHSALAPRPFDGIENILLKLKNRGVKLALVTGKSRESADITLERFKIGEFFDEIGCGGLSGTVKTTRIKEILCKWKIPANGVYYVGDNPQDVIDARGANVIPLSVAWSELVDRQALVAQNPAEIFDTIAQFDSWIDSLAR